MGQSEFLRALTEHGRVRVAALKKQTSEVDDPDIDVVLREWDAVNRAEFPGAAPPLAPPVARWALEQFYRACQFAVYREAGAADIAALAIPCPSAPAAARHYSVDLVFRFLPDLFRLTKAAAEGDPLCDHVRRWAAEWPLSSVGIAGVNPIDVSPVCEDRGLLQQYVDRVIARRDVSRLADARVRAAVRAALGHFDDLAPPLAAALKNYDRSDESPAADAVTAL
jgi:hypothetical protein